MRTFSFRLTKAALIIIKGIEETRRKYVKCSFSKARV